MGRPKKNKTSEDVKKSFKNDSSNNSNISQNMGYDPGNAPEMFVNKNKPKKTNNKTTKTKKQDPFEYIKKKYGEGKIFSLPEKNEGYNPKDFINSGSMCLNYIMTGDYRCGFPKNRPIELSGREGVCKSTLALTASKYATRNKKMVLYSDAENGLNEHYAKQLKINRDYFHFFISDNMEEAFEISEDLLSNFDYDMFVFDSIGGSRPKSYMEGDYSDKNIGSHAKLTGKGVLRLGKICIHKNTAMVLINQIGDSNFGGFGPTSDTKGGKTLKFQLWIRVELTAPRGGKVEEKIKQKGTLDDVIDVEKNKEEDAEDGKKKKSISNTIETGTIIRAKTIKNKFFVPYRTCRLKLIYGKGFDKKFDFLEYLDMHGLAKRDGKKKIIYNKKGMLNSSFWKKYKEDDVFKKEIWEKIENHRKSLQMIEEDESFLD